MESLEEIPSKDRIESGGVEKAGNKFPLIGLTMEAAFNEAKLPRSRAGSFVEKLAGKSRCCWC